MAGADKSDFPDMTTGEEVAQVLAGMDLTISPTTSALMAGRAHLLMREAVAYDEAASF